MKRAGAVAVPPLFSNDDHDLKHSELLVPETSHMSATYDEETGRLHGVRENPDGSIDETSLPPAAERAVDDITDWVYACQLDGTIEDVTNMVDTRRWTPRGDRRAPKFVRFHQYDSGKRCDEIFWEGVCSACSSGPLSADVWQIRIRSFRVVEGSDTSTRGAYIRYGQCSFFVCD